MKTLKFNLIFLLVLFASVSFVISSCGDNATGPQVEDPKDPDPPDNYNPPTSDDFIIDSDNITKTEDGFKFEGSLSGKNGKGVEFKIGEGEFRVVLGEDSVIVSITGTGIPEFPDIGIFTDMLEEFAWEKIESHIEYFEGSHYINEFETDIPLNPERYYLHFRVFDESRDGKFEIRRRANDFIFDFADLYIDINDPAIFFKTQVPIPDGDGKEADDAVESFWKKIASLAAEKGIQIGENLFDVDSGTYVVMGFSNQGTFTTPEYELSDFGLKDPEIFKEFTGFDNLPALPSHAYLKFSSFPIPGTYGLLELSGEMSSYSENGNKLIPIDILVNRKEFSRTESYLGKLSLTAPGLGLLLEGILPAINERTGRELFGQDIDLDPIEGFMQYRVALPGENPAFFRFGGSFNTPILEDIFGADIQKFLISKPGQNSFVYFNIGPETGDAFFYTEADMQMVIPYYGKKDLLDSHFLFNSDGINFSSEQELEVGPITTSNKLNGEVYRDGYALSTLLVRDITLPNNVILGNKELDLSVSSDSGAFVSGQVILPFSIGEATVDGQIITEGLTMRGRVSAGSQLALATGLNLPTRELELSVSTNPDSVLALFGETQMPFIGYNKMIGVINQNQFLFKGEIDRTLTFGNLDVPITNGVITIDSNTGILLDGSISLPFLGSAAMEGEVSQDRIYFANEVNRNLPFSGVNLLMSSGSVTLDDQGSRLNGTLQLPANLRTAEVSGSITQSVMALTGSLGSALTFYGYDFAISNSTITASTASGITAAYTIRLNGRLNAKVSGTISQSGYHFTGSNNFIRDLPAGASMSGSINTTLTQSGISMTATGIIKGLLGNTLFQGGLVVKPNWSNRSIEVCTPNGSYCVGI